MSVFGRAISLLRQAEVILDEQVVVDLRVLRMDTASSGGAGPADCGTLSESAQSRWLDVLAAVAPTLVLFGREMDRVDAYLKQRKHSLLFMASIVCTTECAVLFGAFMVASSVMSTNRGNLSAIFVSVGVATVFALVMLAVFGSWSASTNEMYRKARFQEDLPVKHELNLYRATLSNSFVVLLVAGVVSGHDLIHTLSTTLSAVDARFGKCTPGPATPGSCATSGIDPCKLASITLTTLPSYINQQCTANLLSVLDALIDLKELGVDRYDQGSLWRGVQTGVDVVGGVVLVVDDGDDPASVLTRDVVDSVIATEVAPILCLPGVALKGAFVLSPDASAAPPGRLVALEDGGAGDTTASDLTRQTACFRTCMDSEDCAVAYYDPATTACYNSTSYDAASSFVYGGSSSSDQPRSIFLYNPAARQQQQTQDATASSEASETSGAAGASGAAFRMCGVPGWNPRAGSGAINLSLLFQDQSSSSSSSSPAAAAAQPGQVCVSTTAGNLYKMAVDAGAAASTMLDQTGDLSNHLMRVVRRYKFAVDLDQHRAAIDAALSAYYGDSAYAGGVSSAVDAVFKRTRALVQVARGSGAVSPYIDVDRLAEKLGAMTPDDVAGLQTSLAQLQQAAVSHRDLYPAYRPVSTLRTSRLVSTLVCLSLLLSFCVYVSILVNMFVTSRDGDGPPPRGAISTSTVTQRILVGLCIFIITATVIDSLSAKTIARLTHNQDAVDNNGEMLVAATIRLSTDLDRVLDARQRGSKAEVTAACSAYLDDSRILLDKYAACNSITYGQGKMPFPVADMVLYGTIALVFMVFVTLCVYRIAPFKRFDNIRSLYGLRARILRGETRAYAEANHVVRCVRTPAEVWSIFTWLVIVCFIMVTMWVVLMSFDTEDRYTAALAMEDDCK